MHVSEGILTSTGGMTSHAAVVARGMGTPCVAGAGALQIDATNKQRHRQRQDLRPAGLLSLDGGTGEVMEGQVADRQEAVADRRVRADHEVGGQVPHAEGPHERRHAARRGSRPQLRRRRHRPVPHRAHVLRPAAHPPHARDDPRDRHRRPQDGARQAAAVPARRLHRHLQGDEGPAGHDPPARPAAARVPAAQREGPGRAGARRWA